MKAKGYQGLQDPTWEKSWMNLKLAADFKNLSYDLEAKASIEICEIASYQQDQDMAISSFYQELFQGFISPKLNSNEQVKWAQEQLELSIKASVYLGTTYAQFIQKLWIEKSSRAFEYFVRCSTIKELNKRLLGLE